MEEEIKSPKNCAECTIYHNGKYCLSCKKNIVNKNSRARRTKQNRLLFVSNCAICGKKKWRFVKNQEGRRSELHQVVF